MFNALDIALWFLAKVHSEKSEIDTNDEYDVYEGITHLKLQKLLYYAQGVYMSLNNGELLFDNEIVAWPHGPVVEEVYNKYKSNGRSEIETKLNTDEITKMSLVDSNEKAKKALELTYKEFGCYTAWQLREKTHELGTPWNQISTTKGLYNIIPNEIILKYFLDNIFEE